MHTEQDTQDYRDGAPVPPLPDPEPVPTKHELFKAGLKSWRATQWSDAKALWAKVKPHIWCGIQVLSLVTAFMTGCLEIVFFMLPAPEGVPAGLHWGFGISAPIGLSLILEYAHHNLVEEGRRVLGLEGK